MTLVWFHFWTFTVPVIEEKDRLYSNIAKKWSRAATSVIAKLVEYEREETKKKKRRDDKA